MITLPSWGGASFIGPLIGLLVLWSVVWKGVALWRAARRAEVGWFVVLLVVNTAGILEILYIFVFSDSTRKGFHEPAAHES